MEAKTKRRIDKVIAEAVELVEGGMDEFDAAREALTAQVTDVLRELAIAALVDTVRRRQRSNVLDIERRSARPNVAQELPNGNGPRDWATNPPRSRSRSSREYRAWVAETDEGKAYEAEQQRIEEDSTRKLFKTLGEIADQMVAELRMEWTAELLSSEFGLPDGTRVTWGSATVEQHEERAAMFMRNAITNAEGAARHRKAIDQLKASGAPTLADLVGVAA